MSPFPLHVATLENLELFVGEDNNWMAKSDHHWCDTPALQAKKSLLWLPLLEHDYSIVREALVAGLTHATPEQVAQWLTAFPVLDLLRLAFTNGVSLYWVNLALGWAAQVDLDLEVRGYVRALALNSTVPQATRHRAKRLYYTGKV